MKRGTRYDPLPFYLVHLDSACCCCGLVEPSLMYLGPKQVGTNFKEPVNPNKPKKERAADRRPGMSPEHLANIRDLPCCVCGKAAPSDAHHLKIRAERGVGLKATDRWALPLCREHHMEVEKVGTTEQREEAYFLKHHVSCYVLSRALWNAPRDLESLMKIIEAHGDRAIKEADDAE